MLLTDKLLVYRNFENGEMLFDIAYVIDNYKKEEEHTKQIQTVYSAVNELINLSVKKGFKGNLWHTYITYLLANNENAYSTSCEIRGEILGSINDLALNDFKIFKELYNYDFSDMEESLGVNCFSMIKSFERTDALNHTYNVRIRNAICDLSMELDKSQNEIEFKNAVTKFYGNFGVGKYGLHKAFRILEGYNDDEARIVPIRNILHVSLDDLVGYEIQKKKLVDNTMAFIEGKRANNCLLFGDAGTGKSSSIKAILNQFYDKGLRIIEIYKHQFKDLSSVISQIKNRNYKFIIYMDDLSFEEFEIEYKYLKAIIEGGLEKKPDNVLIYATSNRRHLVRENFSDRPEISDDKHANDTVAEKLSLVSRFGVQIYFGSPDKKEFQNIVKALAKRNNIEMDEAELLLEANKWELSHGGLSGRTAKQFIDYLDYALLNK